MIDVRKIVSKTIKEKGFWKISRTGDGYVILHNDENEELKQVLTETLVNIQKTNTDFDFTIRTVNCFIDSEYETGAISIAWIENGKLDMEILAWEEM